MKTRNSFVANSSSSSFLIVSLGNEELLNRGYGQDEFESSCASMDIDALMEKLTAAKANGTKTIEFEFGGGYCG